MIKLPTQMKCVDLLDYGDVSNLKITNTCLPDIKDNEVLIKVHYAGVNRPDILHRKGIYKPPANASKIMGLEVAGVVVKMGKKTKNIKIGDKVCALVPGGGYAQYCATNFSHCLKIPSNLTYCEAASFPETLFTVWFNLFMLNNIKTKKSLLVHGGSSGIGVTVIQIAKHYGLEVFTTVKNERKQKVCQALGADLVINYQKQDFLNSINKYTNGKGVDVVVDFIGGDYIAKNITLLKTNGIYIFLAFLKGSKVNIDLLPLLYKNIKLTASTLRRQETAVKTKIAKQVNQHLWPLVAKKKIKPIIYKVLPLAKVKDAHNLMESNKHIGKIMLKVI